MFHFCVEVGLLANNLRQGMTLEFVRRCDLGEGGPNVPLTSLRRVKSILGDGSCLLHSFSYLITGTKEQYAQVREAILNHLCHIEHCTY